MEEDNERVDFAVLYSLLRQMDPYESSAQRGNPDAENSKAPSKTADIPCTPAAANSDVGAWRWAGLLMACVGDGADGA